MKCEVALWIHIKVKKLNHPINLEIAVPGSKSITNRALFLAALGNEAVHLKGVLFSEDSRYFLSSLKSLGFSVEIREEEKGDYRRRL